MEQGGIERIRDISHILDVSNIDGVEARTHFIALQAPEEIYDLLWEGPYDSHGEPTEERNKCVLEAYRRGRSRGQKAGA